METSTQPHRTESPPRQRTGCFGVFRKFGRSALKKVGRSNRDARVIPQPQPAAPISTLAVDESRENAPPTLKSEVLEVDSREPSEFNFEVSVPSYFGSAASRERLAALCARYGLPQEAETFHASPTDATVRVTKQSRQRVRMSCHVCNTTFKGDRTCSKCGHLKCADCKRRSITASTTSSEKLADEDLGSERDIEIGDDDVPAKEPDTTFHDAPRPVIETAKYNCHKCSSEFASSTNAVCETCGHEKCLRCSRQVIHLTSLDDEESGRGKDRDTRQNRVYRPVKQRVRHYCESCSEMFPPRTNVCPSCLHKRCKSCTRRPTKKRKTRPTTAAGEEEGQEHVVEHPPVGQGIPILSESGTQGEIPRSS